jgi:hypothetical protein
MKTLNSSDLNGVALNTMNDTVNFAAIRLSTPLSTAEIWGFGAAHRPDSAIWGTLGVSATQRMPPSTAIWGTRSFGAPMQRTDPDQHSRTEWIS